MDYGYPNRRFVRESRPFDYVYDNTYTTSSRRDFYTMAGSGARRAAEVKMRPIYQSMFSELKRDNRLDPCLVNKDSCLTQKFVGSSATGIPEANVPYIREFDPRGADRALFAMSYAPMTDYKMEHSIPPFDMDEEIRKSQQSKTGKLPKLSRSVQTDYRESETQTDPYSPSYVNPPGTTYPRLLALINLTWGKGLPPSLDDIVTIEQALARRSAELEQVNLDNINVFMQRIHVMKELEAHVWAQREKELTRIMTRKIEITKKVHERVKGKMATVRIEKLEILYKIEKQKHKKMTELIDLNYMRDVRKLERKFCQKGKVSQMEGILAEHGYRPDTYELPETLTQRRKIQEYETGVLKDFNVFDQLTSTDSFKQKYLDFDCKEFSRCISRANPSNRDKRTEKILEDAFLAFRREALKRPEIDSIGGSQGKKTQVRRVPVPFIIGPSPEEENTKLSVILLQKIIRGRTVQTMMRDEIRSNAAILNDIKTLHKMDPTGLNATYGEVQAIRLMRLEREAQAEKANTITEITEQLEGETLAQQFEFLDKEMVRLQDERRVHSLLILAERERRMNEAIEAGRRQREEDERRINDEIFREIVGIHQGTVDTYLEDMYLSTIERTADADARRHVRNLASIVNEATHLREEIGHDDSEEMTADIVHSFLMPEINRIHQRLKMEALNNRYFQASCEVVDSTNSAKAVVRQIIDSLPTIVTKHMNLGEAAVAGTQIMVDQVIRKAVGQALKSPKDSGESEFEPDTCEIPPIKIPLVCQKEEMAVKSVELASGTEVGPYVGLMMEVAKQLTREAFNEADNVVKSYYGDELRGEIDSDTDD